MNVTATLFGQMITFVVFVWFIKAYLWEPLTQAMENRTKQITDGLVAAEQGQKKIEQATIEFSTRIDEAKTKASSILSDAESKSKNILEEAREAAREEAKKIAKSSSQQLEQEINAAREKLKDDVAELSVLCAERIISKEVDKGMHDKIINEVINK